MVKVVPAAPLASDLDGAAERTNPGDHDIDADTAPGDIAHGLAVLNPGRASTRSSRSSESPSAPSIDQTLRARLSPGSVPVDAPAVVAQPQRDVVSLAARGDQDPAFFGLARRQPLLRCV